MHRRLSACLSLPLTILVNACAGQPLTVAHSLSETAINQAIGNNVPQSHLSLKDKISVVAFVTWTDKAEESALHDV